MRQLTTLPNADDAQRLADYLLTLKIETRVDQEPEGWAVWVCDEDRLPQARQELEAFTQNPRDGRYTTAVRAAQTLRREEDHAEEEYARRQNELRRRMTERPPASRSFPWTIGLIAVSVLVTLASKFGDANSRVTQKLVIQPYVTANGMIYFKRKLAIISQGEVWRLITPIFLHFNFPHLAFDMYVLWIFGATMEMRRGSGRFMLLVLASAVLSNVAQFYLGHMTWEAGRGLVITLAPSFGGMSGVDYALFGYIWMKSRFEPELGFVLDPINVLFMIGWFFLCLSGLIGNIANLAHAVGLLIGIVVGYAPTLWRSLRG
jgi:GlpG protein